jgi:hypothetical protein
MLLWDAVVARHLSEQMEGGWAGLQYPFVGSFVDDYPHGCRCQASHL